MTIGGLRYMFKITKVINNNIVCSVDSNGNEIILRGLGIGFKKQPGAVIRKDKVEKIYKMLTKENLTDYSRCSAELINERFSVKLSDDDAGAEINF